MVRKISKIFLSSKVLFKDLMSDDLFSINSMPMDDNGLWVFLLKSAPIVKKRKISHGDVVFFDHSRKKVLIPRMV